MHTASEFDSGLPPLEQARKKQRKNKWHQHASTSEDDEPDANTKYQLSVKIFRLH